MAATVKFSGKVREYSKEKEIDLEFDESMDVSALLSLLIDRYPEIQRIKKYLFVSINGKLVTRDSGISDGDEVMLFFRPGGG